MGGHACRCVRRGCRRATLCTRTSRSAWLTPLPHSSGASGGCPAPCLRLERGPGRRGGACPLCRNAAPCRCAPARHGVSSMPAEDQCHAWPGPPTPPPPHTTHTRTHASPLFAPNPPPPTTTIRAESASPRLPSHDHRRAPGRCCLCPWGPLLRRQLGRATRKQPPDRLRERRRSDAYSEPCVSACACREASPASCAEVGVPAVLAQPRFASHS